MLFAFLKWRRCNAREAEACLRPARLERAASRRSIQDIVKVILDRLPILDRNAPPRHPEPAAPLPAGRARGAGGLTGQRFRSDPAGPLYEIDPDVWQEMYATHIALTGLAVQHQPDVIVWPETMFTWPLMAYSPEMSDE